ncbi:hypothetical protein J7E95_42305 [Streptomyces sp. ISL-14]|nr:hypothetical protein [Streptomyces sp. ISL-14]
MEPWKVPDSYPQAMDGRALAPLGWGTLVLLADRAPLPLLIHSGVLLLIALAGPGSTSRSQASCSPPSLSSYRLRELLVRTARARPGTRPWWPVPWPGSASPTARIRS